MMSSCYRFQRYLWLSIAGALCGNLSFSSIYAESLSSSTRSATWVDSLASITTDTGDFAPGHRDFTAYQTPLLCWEAANEVRMTSRRTLAAQAVVRRLQDTPERDTLPADVARIARACGARFTLANTAVADLPDLISLALLANNDTLAQRALAHYVALQSTDSAKIRVMLDAVERYLEAEPARVTAAESLASQLDHLHPMNVAASILAHVRLLHYGEYSLDRVRMRHEAEWIIQHTHMLTARQYVEYRWDEYVDPFAAYGDSWSARMRLALIEQPSAMPEVAKQAQQDYQRLGVQGVIRKLPNFADAYAADSKKMTMPIDNLVTVLLRSNGNLSHKPAPQLHASYWFPSTSDTVQPRSGIPTLIVYLRRCYFANGDLYGLNEDLTVPIEWIQQLRRRYRPDQLAIVVVAATWGHALFNGPQAASDEARDIAWYVRDYWHLPVTVAVQQRPFTVDPPPVSEREYARSEYEKTYGDDMVLISRDGTVSYQGNLDWANPWYQLHRGSRDINMQHNTIAEEDFVEALLTQQIDPQPTR